MIVKILNSTGTFNAVRYNTDKIDRGQGELLKFANFGALQGLQIPRPSDVRNFLKAMSARNSKVSQPQFHAVISAKGREHTKEALSEIAEKWIKAMSYGKQPYLIVFHGDTANNHVHIVSTRIDWNSRKISDSYERLRAQSCLANIMQQDNGKDLAQALSYRFTTIAQFKLVLELRGRYDLIKEQDLSKLEFHQPSEQRALQLKAIFQKYRSKLDTDVLVSWLKDKMGVELVFHSKNGQPAYGYTIIDHAQKNVYKGGQVLPLRELLSLHTYQAINVSTNLHRSTDIPVHTEKDTPLRIAIAGDIDDEAIHGMKRNRKKKARTNLR